MIFLDSVRLQLCLKRAPGVCWLETEASCLDNRLSPAFENRLLRDFRQHFWRIIVIYRIYWNSLRMYERFTGRKMCYGAKEVWNLAWFVDLGYFERFEVVVVSARSPRLEFLQYIWRKLVKSIYGDGLMTQASQI